MQSSSRVKGRYVAKKHYSWKHKLGKKWTRVMGVKTWHTVSEDCSRRGVLSSLERACHTGS